MKLKINLLIFITAAVFLLLVHPAFAAEDLSDITEIVYGDESYLVENYLQFQERISGKNRPVVGLALSGGGARAIVNFGIVKALRENGIPIDFLVGTSMGAIVSVIYGGGLPVDQMTDIISSTPFVDLLNIGISGGGSLLDTEKVNLFLERISPNKRLEDFPVPAALLSFNLSEGKKYLATSGRISEEIQSSYSIPFYFPIHSKGEDYFIDAGILEATPAKAASLLGADIVIATTSFDNFDLEDYGSASRSAGRFLNIIQKKHSTQIINRYADIVIECDVGDYSFMDFNMAEKFIQIGYETAVDMMPEIKAELAKKGVTTVDYIPRKHYNISGSLRDLEYDRFVTQGKDLEFLLYYGRDHSIFKQEMLRSPLNDFQTGLEFKNKNLSLGVLEKDGFDSGYEAFFRFAKMTEQLDFFFSYSNDYDSDTEDDYEGEIKYFGERFNFGFGEGRRMDEEYYLFGADFREEGKKIEWQTENDIIFLKDESESEILSSHYINYDFSRAWGIETRLVYNSSDILPSPVIYRGRDLDDFEAEFQSAVNFNYNYRLSEPFELLQVFQMTNIGAYLIADYYKDGEGDTASAAGIGVNSKLYLLGLKPIELDIYTAYDFDREDERFGVELGYKF
ncbi:MULTISPECIES: patatin-like phospholipase family protein [unclassified Halanaerobium]|uniref:patatin-like phospholipase family protein n=1 Tax=unclassified Halanaerobium TaxID=2641197 RepID=UPI000E19E812|nr:MULTISPECIES: patatin-like phospholipase family protein [unclassified Halanaerobium]RCW43824.1 NTE family protein [Halanaerobium sp. MA284_MarDTE_T2]RCW80525.1 NTE family protein [Halanaerobium sp. DL-01]